MDEDTLAECISVAFNHILQTAANGEPEKLDRLLAGEHPNDVWDANQLMAEAFARCGVLDPVAHRSSIRRVLTEEAGLAELEAQEVSEATEDRSPGSRLAYKLWNGQDGFPSAWNRSRRDCYGLVDQVICLASRHPHVPVPGFKSVLQRLIMDRLDEHDAGHSTWMGLHWELVETALEEVLRDDDRAADHVETALDLIKRNLRVDGSGTLHFPRTSPGSSGAATETGGCPVCKQELPWGCIPFDAPPYAESAAQQHVRECSHGRLLLGPDGDVMEAVQVLRVQGPWTDARFQLPDGGTLTLATDAVQITGASGRVVSESTMQHWRENPESFSSTLSEIALALSQGAKSLQTE